MPGRGPSKSCVTPKQTAFTLIPWRATSRASDLEKAITAALVPDCTVSSVAPIFPESEVRLTIRP